MKELYWTVVPKVKRVGSSATKQARKGSPCIVSISNRGKTARSGVSIDDQVILSQLKTGFALSNSDIHLLRWLGKHVEDQQAIDILAAYKFVSPITLCNDTDPQSTVTVFRQARCFPCRASVLVNGYMVNCVAISKNLVGDILCVTTDPFQYYNLRNNLQQVTGIGVFHVPGNKVISSVEFTTNHYSN